jgi:hypothetical protein
VFSAAYYSNIAGRTVMHTASWWKYIDMSSILFCSSLAADRDGNSEGHQGEAQSFFYFYSTTLSILRPHILNESMITFTRPCVVSDRMINECGAPGGMRIGRGNLNTKLAAVPLCPPQISFDLTWNQTQATLGTWHLTILAVV